MRKTIRLIAISFIVFIIFFAMNFTVYGATTATVTSPDIKLRRKADNTSTVLELIPKNEQIEVLEQNGKWSKVKYKKITGYVHSEYIKVKEEIVSSSSNDKKDENTNEKDTKVTDTQIGDVQTTAQPADNEVAQSQEVQIGDNVYVKKEESLHVLPLINSDVVTNLNTTQQLKVIQILNGWVYANTDTYKGWIRYDELTKNKDQATQTQPQQPTTPQEEPKEDKKEEEAPKTTTPLNKTGYVITDGINFRESKQTSSKVIKVLSQNAQLNIIEEDEQWYKATFKGETGYILKSYVSSKKVTTSRGTEVQRQEKQEDSENQEETKKEITNISKGQEVVEYVKTFLGYRYVYGGASPSRGFDCSGLTMYVYQKFGVNLPHSATAQSKIGTKVEKSNLQLGDLVFFSDYRTYKGIGHCGIYIGDNKFIHASTEKTGVITSSLTSGSYVKRYVTATRVM